VLGAPTMMCITSLRNSMPLVLLCAPRSCPPHDLQPTGSTLDLNHSVPCLFLTTSTLFLLLLPTQVFLSNTLLPLSILLPPARLNLAITSCFCMRVRPRRVQNRSFHLYVHVWLLPPAWICVSIPAMHRPAAHAAH